MPQPLTTLDLPPADELFDGELFKGFDLLNAELARRGLSEAEIGKVLAGACAVLAAGNRGLAHEVPDGLELVLRICVDSFQAAQRAELPAASAARHDAWLTEALADPGERNVVRIVARMLLVCEAPRLGGCALASATFFAALRMTQHVRAMNDKWPAPAGPEVTDVE